MHKPSLASVLSVVFLFSGIISASPLRADTVDTEEALLDEAAARLETSVWEAGDAGAEYCGRTRGSFLALALDPSQRLSFANHGGISNGGVCWWHSRFQRASLYLTVYRPELPKPTRAEARVLIHAIRKMRQVVVIPGYRDLSEFSKDFQFDIQSQLERWQLFDGIVGFRWIDGLMGASKVSASRLKRIMDRFYGDMVSSKAILLQKLQVPGLPAHAWNVVSMAPTGDGGYGLQVIDSNLPNRTLSIRYAVGDRQLELPYGWVFVPYEDYNGDLRKEFRAFRKFCGQPL